MSNVNSVVSLLAVQKQLMARALGFQRTLSDVTFQSLRASDRDIEPGTKKIQGPRSSELGIREKLRTPTFSETRDPDDAVHTDKF